MNFTPQDFVHYLLAAAGAIPLDQHGIFLIAEEDNDLIEKLWTGTEIAEQVFITSDVRGNTPALYLLNENKRCVFCVDTNSILRCYGYNADEEEWEEVTLQSNKQITIHPSSRLSGCFAPGGQIVFFQDVSGQLQMIKTQSGGNLESFPPLPVASQPGTPHSVVVSDDNVLHLLYIHQDNHIHDLAQGLKSGEWRDTSLHSSGLDDYEITNFMAIPNDDLTFEICALSSAGKLIRIDKKGVITELEKVSQGRSVPLRRNRCVVETAKIAKKVGRGVWGKAMEIYQNEV